MTTLTGSAQPGWRLEIGTGLYAIVAGALLFAASDPIYPTLMKGPSEWVLDVPGLDRARRLAWLAIYMVMLCVMYTMRARVLPALANQHFFFLACAYFILSSLWAAHPMEGIVGGVQALFTMTFGILIGARLGSEGIIRAFYVAGILVVGFSLLFVVILPQHAFGFRYNTGALRGVYIEKNHLALIMSYTVWAAAFMWLQEPRSKFRLGFLLISTMMCVMAVSSIALLQLVLITFCVTYSRISRGLVNRGIIAFLIFFSAMAFLMMALPVILGMLGEDLTFNGRTTLWGHLWTSISQHPIIGHGYRGFWHSHEAEQMRIALGWPAHGAHNVWIQALLYGGLIGFALWVAQWWSILQRAGRAFSQNQDIRHVGMAVLVFMTLLWSLFETTQLQHFTHNAIVTGMVFALRGPKFR